MKISEVFKEYSKDVNVESIMDDSRKKENKAIFFCIDGKYNDGHNFVDMAISNGAICIVHSKELNNYRDDIAYVRVDDTMYWFNVFTAKFYDNVSEKMKVFAVTGTSGKTTSAYILADIISHFEKSAYIGSIGYLLDGELIDDTGLTTPRTLQIHQILNKLYKANCKAVCMEASSEGIETHRIDTVNFESLIFTNLAPDHIDFHGSMENYFMAKAKLFLRIPKDKIVIINSDDEYGQRLINMVNCRVASFGFKEGADYYAKDIKEFNDHIEFTLVHDNKEYFINTNLIASFNIYNLLGDIALCNENGYPLEKVIPYLNNIKKVPGRCVVIDEGQDFNVLLDLAFNGNAFEKIFKYAKSITPKENKIICVFGQAGNRDKNRRIDSCAIADKYCDYIVLTTDNPAFEDPDEIAKELESYLVNIKPTYIKDREKAIEYGLSLTNKGDTLCVLGKGDEAYMIYGNKREPYKGDEYYLRKYIKELKK